MRQERRKHPRLEIPLEISLQLEGSDDVLFATMEDLSAGGAGLLTTTEVPVGTDIRRLQFDMPIGGDEEPVPIEVAGRVARCLQQPGLGGEAEFLIGIQFVDITRELFDRIQGFVFQRLRSSQKERVPIERPIAIRFDRFDDFVDEVSVNLSTSGMFIRTRDPRPPGSVFKFQFQLGEDFSLIEGRAEVVWRRRHSEGPDKQPGMGVKFINLDVPSQRLIDRLIKQRQEAEDKVETSETLEAKEPPVDAAADSPHALEEEIEPAAEAISTMPPPALEQAEASIVSLHRVNTLRNEAVELRDELDEARREHDRELQELRARLEDRQAAATSELEERLRDAEAAHKESERVRGELAGELDGLRRDLDQTRDQAGELQRLVDDSTSESDLEALTTERNEIQAARGELHDELERTRAEAEELQRQLDNRTSEEEIERLTGEHGELQTAHAELQATHGELQSAHDERRAAHKESERLRGELAGELDGLRRDFDQARTQAGELQRLVDDSTSESDLEALTTERDELQAARGELHDELERTRAEAEELQRQLDNRTSEEEIERLTGEHGELQTAHAELQATHGELQSAHDERRAAFDELQAAHDQRQAAFDGLQAAHDQRQAALDELQSAHDERQAALDGLQSAHEELQADLERLRHEAGELRDQLEERTPEEEVQRLGSEVGGLQATNLRLLADLDLANGEADKMRLRLADRSAEREIERLADERAELESAHNDLQAANDGLQAEIGRIRDEAAGLRAALEARLPPEEAERLSAERESLESTRDRLLADLDRTNEEADELRRQLADRERAETNLAGELEGARSEIDRLQRAYEASLLQLQTDHSKTIENTVAEFREEAAARLQELTAEHEDRIRREAEMAREERERLEAEVERERQSLRAEAEAAGREAAAELDGVRQELSATNERAIGLEGEVDSMRQELKQSRNAAAEEAELALAAVREEAESSLVAVREKAESSLAAVREEAESSLVAGREEAEAALTAARQESERLRAEIAGAEESKLTLESEVQQVRDEARQASLHAEERESALRAEAENAVLAATGGVPLPAAEPPRGRRALTGAALLLIGALLGTLAVAFIKPLGSLAARLRPGGEETVLAQREPEAPVSAPAAAQQPAGQPVTLPAAGTPEASPVVAEPAPVAEPEPGPDPATAEQAVRDWAAAWSDQRVDDYLDSYANTYQPPDGQSRDSWAANRRQRILRPRSIDVGVEDARTVELSADRVSVSFDQAYASDTFSDRVRKTLHLVWQDEAWKITEEFVIE